MIIIDRLTAVLLLAMLAACGRTDIAEHGMVFTAPIPVLEEESPQADSSKHPQKKRDQKIEKSLDGLQDQVHDLQKMLGDQHQMSIESMK